MTRGRNWLQKGVDKIAEGYFKKKEKHNNSNIEETKERRSVLKYNIKEDMCIE